MSADQTESRVAISLEAVRDYQALTFRTLPGQRLHTPAQAVDFVRQRGFIFFWPITGVRLPSLWAAVAGDRPVADAHDDPGHVTWGWKDASLGKRQWYYAKVLRKKATIIDLDIAPYFYALSENYGSPEDDYLTLYEQGRLTQEARLVYEALLAESPLDTIALRRATHMTSSTSDSRFNRALMDLQADFKILPVGVTQSGAWHYAFAYDITARHFPELPDQAHSIRTSTARNKLAELYFRSLGAAPLAGLSKLFGWPMERASRTVDNLVESGILRRGLLAEGHPGEWVALTDLTGD